MESDETNMPPFIGLARPLSAQAEAMPAQEVIGERCIDGGKCHHRCESKCFRRECCGPLSGYTGPWKYEEMQAQEPVAWTMRELCRFFAYAYRAGHEDTCEAVYTHVLECDADTYHQDSVIEYLTDNGISAAPPDLTARVRELEAALRNLLNDAQHSEHHCGDEACPVSIARAVLAKETQ